KSTETVMNSAVCDLVGVVGVVGVVIDCLALATQELR
ncbi:MAG: hypothetical protein RLZ49_1025, partial [Actinomycetota bacterium]